MSVCQYQNQTDYILCSRRWRSSIQSAKTRPGADCVSDHQLLIAKFRLKSKKVEKTTRPFRYNLNQIPYNCTVEMTNKFKGLELVDRVPEELWTEVCNILQEAVTKTIWKKKKCRKEKWLSEEALQIAEERKEAKGKGVKERYTQLMRLILCNSLSNPFSLVFRLTCLMEAYHTIKSKRLSLFKGFP